MPSILLSALGQTRLTGAVVPMTCGPSQTDSTRALRLAVGRGFAACHEALLRMVSSARGAGLALAGYPVAPMRQPVARQDLAKRRRASDAEITKTLRVWLGEALERTKVKYDQDVAGEKVPPTVNALIISGGGDWGAFGAGYLKGWRRVAAVHPLAMPEFDVVTGVSTGTLIAPFAFLGDTQSIDSIANLYRNPGADWVKPRGRLYFLPDNISFAEVPGLEREVRNHLNMDLIRRIAEAGADGRFLAINTTNLDYAAAMAHEQIEQLRVLFLDRKNALIADEVQQRGTVDHTPVYPREVMKRALILNASALIVVHNHPSGDPKPSRDDIEMTRRLKDAASAVEIALHDHVVIGHGTHASFRSLGLL